MNPKLYSYSKCYSTNKITFYLYNLSGQIVGYQHYRPLLTKKKNNHPKQARYYTYLPREVDGMFGLDLLDYSKKDLFVVEGIFKAAVLHRLGFNAIAVLTSTPKRLRSLFRILRRRLRLIGIGDNDKAGQSLVNVVGFGCVSPEDLDEMSDNDILTFLSSFAINK